MKYLLDTNVLIKWLTGDVSLKTDVNEIISSKNFVKYVSVVSVWEMIIKTQINKLKVVIPIEKVLEDFGFEILNVNLSHVLKVGTLPLLHKDPFDRILVAQSMIEKCELLTTDKIIKKYF